MNLRNITISIAMMTVILGNSVVAFDGSAFKEIDLATLAAVGGLGAAGAGAGLVLGAQKGKVVGIAHEEKLGSKAETIGKVGGGVTGMVAGGIAGAVLAYGGCVVIKAVYEKMK